MSDCDTCAVVELRKYKLSAFHLIIFEQKSLYFFGRCCFYHKVLSPSQVLSIYWKHTLQLYIIWSVMRFMRECHHQYKRVRFHQRPVCTTACHRCQWRNVTHNASLVHQAAIASNIANLRKPLIKLISALRNSNLSIRQPLCFPKTCSKT